MLGITIQLDISVTLTPQVITIICHRLTKNIIKKEKKKIENIKIWGDQTKIHMLTKTIHR